MKCKNFEKEGTCKYGIHCTFAHGDRELRNKTDNLFTFQPAMPMMFNPNFMMDINAMNIMPMMPGVGVPMNFPMMPEQLNNAGGEDKK